MLSCLASIRYFARDPERSIVKHVILPLAGVAALGYPLYFVAKPGQSYPYNLVPYLVLAWVVLGVAAYFYFRATAPRKLAAIGRLIAEEEDDVAEGRLLSAPL